MRNLAIVKLRELRSRGLSYRQIGLRYGAPRGTSEVGRSDLKHRLSPERLLAASQYEGNEVVGLPGEGHAFIQALDAVREGLAFFNLTGEEVASNHAFSTALSSSAPPSSRLRQEIDHFVFSLCTLVQERDLEGVKLQALAVREVPIEGDRFYLRGSYIGFDLFQRGSSLLLELERIRLELPDDETICRCCGLTPKESRIAHLLAEGKSNEEIARTMFISPHTARTHTKRVLEKLGVDSRAKVRAVLARAGEAEA